LSGQRGVWTEFAARLEFKKDAPTVSPYYINGELDLLPTDESVLHDPFSIKRFTPVLSHAAKGWAGHQGTVIGKRQGNEVVPYYAQRLSQGSKRFARRLSRLSGDESE
jgi:hypothetical protein